MWSGVNLYFHEYFAGSITLVYILISLFNLYICKHKERETIFIRSQMLLMLLFPFMMMWSLGGIQNGSNTMIWAFISPILAILYTDKHESKYWLIAFLALLSISVLIDPMIPKHDINATFNEMLFLLNTAAVLSGIYIVLRYFVDKTKANVDNSTSILNSYKTSLEKNLIVTRTDLEGNITYANDNFYKVSGFSKHETIGNTHRIIKHPDTPVEVYKELWATILSKQTWQGQIQNRRKDGTSYWVETTISPLLDKDGNIVEFIAIRYNISELIKKQKELTTLLRTDTLTGLKSRKALLQDKAHHDINSLILINIDKFSQINNLYGEDFGDKVLKKFSIFLEQGVKIYNDCDVYRLGGDEFVILSEEKNPRVLMQNVKELIEHLQHSPVVIQDQEIDLNVTVGISLEKNANLLETASMALKHSKRTGKNITVYSEEISLNSEYENNLKWAKEIKDAIEHNRVILYYQAIQDNKSGKIYKYETLIRLQDRFGNIIPPGKFLDIAKKSKLYKELTKIVVSKSFEFFQDKEYSFSVNITIEDILDKEIYNFILEQLRTHDIGEKVSFEIVETEGIEEFDKIESFINDVKKFGCKISIDDFGTGYSNFEYLMRLQADYIKIDGSIIRNIVHDKKSALLTSIIVSFAKEMNITTIGEYVESEEIANKLKELGVDKSQGYFIAKPKEKLV